jgi:hypothetical protein
LVDPLFECDQAPVDQFIARAGEFVRMAVRAEPGYSIRFLLGCLLTPLDLLSVIIDDLLSPRSVSV